MRDPSPPRSSNNDHEVIGFLVKTVRNIRPASAARAAVLFCLLFSARPEADREHFVWLNLADGYEVEELRGRTR